ncbi:MAG: hypothetical protein K0R67_2328 [Paenibacillus sp.]|jgi:CBS-domain-containing membrane protein|nr:hypothetical protein [Paenibacillus sp.]
MLLKRLFQALIPAGGAFTAIYLVQLTGDWLTIATLMAPMGATCILVFTLPHSPLAKPKSVLGGHLISTFIGLVISHTVGNHSWSLALGVGLALLAMKLTNTIHPPAGADPLVVILSGVSWDFLLAPVMISGILIVLTAIGYNRIMNRFL